VCEQLAQSRYVKLSGQDSNLRPLGCKSDVLTTASPITLGANKMIFLLLKMGGYSPIGYVKVLVGRLASK